MTYIIILTWNGKQYLSNLFNSLAALNFPQNKLKIIVVDSASTDGTLTYLENLANQNKIHLIRLRKNLGFTVGNNLGIQYALDNYAEYIVLLNQDTIVEPDFLLQLIHSANADRQIGIVQSLLLYANNKRQINSAGNALHYLGYGFCQGNYQDLANYELPATDVEIIYASAAAVLYKASLLRKVGLFDKNYFSSNEDADLCLRAKFQGYTTVLNPNSIVYHDYRFPTTKSPRRYFWMERNRLYFILKFYKIKTLVLILPMLLSMDLGQFIFSFKNGYLWQFIKSRLWFLCHPFKVLSARRDVQNTRLINDKELMQNFASEIKYQPIDNWLLTKVGNPVMKCWWKIISTRL